MKILVVSGFLGAGKTTFIKELIRRTKKSIVIMENEYGETNLDSKELSKSDSKLEILEFMEGCVCCTMKDSFINSLLAVQASLEPEYLVVEPTGVAKLSSILENINRVSNELMTSLNPVVVLTPRSYFSNMQQYPEIYTDQIKNAAIVVFSKAENEDYSLLEKVSNDILKINPNVEIVSNHYTKKDDCWWNALLVDENEHSIHSQDTIDIDIEEISSRKAYLNNISELIINLEDIIHGRFGSIVRAKGVLKVGHEYLRFDVADGLYAIIGESPQETQCVFIGKEFDEDHLLARFNTSCQAEEHDHDHHHHHHH